MTDGEVYHDITKAHSRPSESKSGVRCRFFGPKKLAIPKKSWEKPQSAVFDVFCHSEHNGRVKFFKKLLWEPVQKLSSLVVRHCTCTFLDMQTPSVGLYPSREGHWSFYPWIPAHFQTWKLCPLACIPPGRGTGVFICGPLHISEHGNSIHWPVSLQRRAPEFLSMDPCTFPDMETPSIGPYPFREGLWRIYL